MARHKKVKHANVQRQRQVERQSQRQVEIQTQRQVDKQRQRQIWFNKELACPTPFLTSSHKKLDWESQSISLNLVSNDPINPADILHHPIMSS